MSKAIAAIPHQCVNSPPCLAVDRHLAVDKRPGDCVRLHGVVDGQPADGLSGEADARGMVATKDGT